MGPLGSGVCTTAAYVHREEEEYLVINIYMFPPFPFSTKRLIVDVIRFQPGETLTEILETPATSEQVKCGGVTCNVMRCTDAPVMRGRGHR